MLYSLHISIQQYRYCKIINGRCSIIYTEFATDEEAQLCIQELVSKGKSFRIMVTGRVGQGKSTLVNNLFGKEVAMEGDGPRSVTHGIQSFTEYIRGVKVTLIDTPGFNDPKWSDLHTVTEIGKVGSIDLILFCVRMDGRVEKTDYRIMRKLTRGFGQSIWEHAVFVLTFANKVDPDTFENKWAEWDEVLHEYARTKGEIQPDIAQRIPVVVAGSDENDLPACQSWLDQFWVTAYNKTKDDAKPAYLTLTLNLNELNELLNCDSSSSEDESLENSGDHHTKRFQSSQRAERTKTGAQLLHHTTAPDTHGTAPYHPTLVSDVYSHSKPAPGTTPAAETGGTHRRPTPAAETGGTHRRPTPAAENGGTHCRPTPPPDTGGTHRRPTPAAETGGTHRRPTPAAENGGTHRQPTPAPDTGGTHRQPTPAPDTGGTHCRPTPAPDTGGTHCQPTPAVETGGTHRQPTPAAENGGTHRQPTPAPDTGGIHRRPTPAPDTGGGTSRRSTPTLDTGGTHRRRTRAPDPGGTCHHATRAPDTGGTRHHSPRCGGYTSPPNTSPRHGYRRPTPAPDTGGTIKNWLMKLCAAFVRLRLTCSKYAKRLLNWICPHPPHTSP